MLYALYFTQGPAPSEYVLLGGFSRIKTTLQGGLLCVKDSETWNLSTQLDIDNTPTY